jgi:gliding motility-associated-like protein
MSPEVAFSIDPAPKSIINAGQDVSVYSMGKTYAMNADPPSFPGETGFWTALEPGTASFADVSDSKSKVRNLTTGRNLFLWSITNGLCSIEDSVYIELLKDFIPQGFSPNGDAWNNTFIIEGLDLEDQVAELTILNGAGTTVYSTSNREGQEWTDWDGRNNRGADLPEGTYYYLLKVTTQSNQVIKKSGFIVLKRY